MTPEHLQKHVFATYTDLRIGMITIAFLFPLLLVVGGLWHGVTWQDSMSHYYHATIGDTIPPMRVWFIGLLYALGAFLFLYKGFSKLEDWCLNFAGLFAVGVARFPMAWPAGSGSVLSTHYVCAVLMFICVAIVTWGCTGQTLSLVPEAKRKKYKIGYLISGLAMGVLPTLIWLYKLFLPEVAERIHQVFLLEMFCIWAFASYWLIKSMELKASLAEIEALKLELTTEPQPPAGPEPARPVVRRSPLARLQSLVVPARRVRSVPPNQAL